MNRKHMRALAVTVALTVAVALANSGCATFTALREGASPAVTYYAALSDYVAAKSTAASYAELPSTSRAEVEKILLATREADEVVEQIEVLRLTIGVPDSKYTAGAQILSSVARLLQAQALKGSEPAAGEVTQ